MDKPQNQKMTPVSGTDQGLIERLRSQIEILKAEKSELIADKARLDRELRNHLPNVNDIVSCSYKGAKFDKESMNTLGVSTFCHLIQVSPIVIGRELRERITKAIDEFWPYMPISPFRRMIMEYGIDGVFDISFERISNLCAGLDVISACYSPNLSADTRNKLAAWEKEKCDKKNG